MTAITKIPPPSFKPRDLVRTADGRTARVLEILPAHRRRLMLDDRTREQRIVPVDELTLVAESPVRPWPQHTL